MIHCPSCGTSNRKGSRFCNECGEPLPSTGVRCPMCNTINAVGNVYCQACNARLVPMSAPPEGEPEEAASRPIKGVSLPTIPLDSGDREREKALEEPPQEESPHEDAPSAPSWLAELRESAEDIPEETEETEDTELTSSEPFTTADIPDWLSEMGPIGEPIERTDVPPPEPGDLPDWIRELGPVREQDSVLSEEGHSPEGAAPEKLVDEDFGATEPATREAAMDEAPDWLRDILGPDTEAGREQGSEDVGGPRGTSEDESLIEIPEWLKEGGEGVPPQPPETQPEAEPPTEGASTDEESTGKEPPAETPLGAIAIPSWLEEAQTDAGKPPYEEPPPPFTETPPEDVDTPDWLKELMASTAVEQEEEDVPPFEEEELEVPEPGIETAIERADIPSWLQELRPERTGGKPTAAGPLETEGLLRGLRGVIPSADAMRAPGVFEGVRTHEPDEASLARAELFQSLLGEPALRARKRSVGETTRTPSLVDRILVACILVAAVVGMLLAPLVVGQGPHLTQPLANAGATRLYDLIQGLDNQDSVLMAFDYGPPAAAELNAAARPVMRHLLERGVALSIVSTRPGGSMVADDLMADIGAQYSLIGYRPGAAMAASQLLGTTDEPPSMLVVLSGQPLPLLLWVEQAKASYGDRLPVAAVGSAALEPLASPYLDAAAGQLTGAVFGYAGGSSYEAIQGATGEATRRLDALAAGHLAIILTMIGGAFVYALSGRGEETQ